MADIAWSDVTGIAAELTTVSLSAQTDILAYVNENVDPRKFRGEDSSRYRLARIFLAAHFGTMHLRQGNPPAGPVVSETEGPLSRSYGVVSDGMMSSAKLMATGWGREYQGLVSRSGAARAPLVT